MDKKTIESILQERFKPTFLEVVDDSHKHAGHAGVKQTGGGHYNVMILAEAFRDKTALQRHRMVYDALSTQWQGNIHALAVKAGVPA